MLNQKNKNKGLFIIFATIILLVVIDQVIKAYAENTLSGTGPVSLISGFISLTYVRNTGAVFGIFQGGTLYLSIFTSIALVAGIAYVIKAKLSLATQVSAVLIISGGLGNLIDRVFRGFVIDYIELDFISFAVFNFADCLITSGSFLLIGIMIYEIILEEKNKKAQISREQGNTIE